MKILWISDFSLTHNIGGAQRSNQLIIEEGKKRQYTIQEFNYNTDPNSLNQDYDLVISCNLEVLSKHLPDIIKYISSRKKHIRLEHDANRYLSQEDRKQLFGSCVATFFLTKFPYDTFVKMYGDIFQNVTVIPDPINSALFYNHGTDRENKILYIGYMHYLKGTNNFFQYIIENPSLNFAMATWGDKQYRQAAESLSNVEWLGNINYDDMPSLYNKYTTLFYHPVGFEPFCRSVGEAIMCGMEINSNDLIGSIHHYKQVGHTTFVQQCNEAAQTFWNTVENTL